MVTQIERLLLAVFLLTAGVNYTVSPTLASTTKETKTQGPERLIQLQEYRQTMFILLDEGQARLLKLSNRICRTSTSDAYIAVPVVVSENEVALVGKAAGRATFTFWDDAGCVVHIGLRVKGPEGTLGRLGRVLAGPACHALAGDPSETQLQTIDGGTVDLEKSTVVRVDPERRNARNENAQPQSKGTPPPWELFVPFEDEDRSLEPAAPPSSSSGPKSEEGTSDGTAIPAAPPPPPLQRIVGDMAPCKIDTVLDLEVGQARVLRVDHVLQRFSESDPRISEPVIVSGHEIVVLGKTPGRATVGLWDVAGGKVGIETRVKHHQGAFGSILSLLTRSHSAAIPPVVVLQLTFEEIRANRNIALEESQATLFKTNQEMVRIYFSNPEVADVLPSEQGVYVWGKSPGNCTAFVWDDRGNVQGLDLHVTGDRRQTDKGSQTVQQGAKNPLPMLADHSNIQGAVRQVECWALDKKSVWDFPADSTRESTQNEDSREIKAIKLNNAGVQALNAGDCQLAIEKLKDALHVYPSYQLARDNLSIAYNQYGLQIRETPREALKQFHQSLYLAPDNSTTLQNTAGIILMLGKDANDFGDRIELADQASANGDLVGAVIEYQAALRIRDDPFQRAKLDEARKRLNDIENKP